jgi:hypothetical protein
MHAINEAATEIMKKLVEGLNEDCGHQKIDNRPGCYMAVHVEQIGQTTDGPLFSVAHYFRQNGDSMRDPDMVFLRCQDNKFYPVSFQQDSLGIYQEVVCFDSFTAPPWVDFEVQSELAEFASSWMLNIQEQQNI